jgi:hypothetical protein
MTARVATCRDVASGAGSQRNFGRDVVTPVMPLSVSPSARAALLDLALAQQRDPVVRPSSAAKRDGRGTPKYAIPGRLCDTHSRLWVRAPQGLSARIDAQTLRRHRSKVSRRKLRLPSPTRHAGRVPFDPGGKAFRAVAADGASPLSRPTVSVRLGAVGQSGDLFFACVLFHDVVTGCALNDSLDVQDLVTGDDEELSGLGANIPILLGGDLEHLLAGRVTALADNAEGFSYGRLNLFDSLIHLAEEGLVLDDPILAGQGRSLLFDQLVGTERANDVFGLGLEVACDDHEAVRVSPHSLVLRTGQLDATQTQIVGTLTQKRDLGSVLGRLLGGVGKKLVRRPKGLLVLH